MAGPAPRRLAAAALVLALAAGCSNGPTPHVTGLPGPSASPSPTSDAYGPGAPGIGDQYFPNAGNGGYDVGDYDLSVQYDPGSNTLTGTAVIAATATANLTSFDLDFTGMTVNSVAVADTPARSERKGGELVITPAQPLARGTPFVTKVSYGGNPTTFNDPDLGPGGFLHNSDGGVAIGEPDVAAAWFPVNDHPRDKATYTIRITAPSALSALANGVLTSKQAAAQAGWTTWTWRESAPMASYLATMVVGNYRLQQSTHDGKPVVTAVDTSLNNQIDTQLARTPEIIDFLATQFGPYPFDAMGGIVVNDRRIQFALENQSRPIYSSLFFQGGDTSTVIAHELAHQWYGDSVSLYDWKDIWLNEGFATYAEWLWEQHIGTNTPQQEFDYYYRSAPTSTLWTVAPAAPGPHMFGRDAYPSVYYRGAMALQALRITVGDDAFFAILKGWAAQEANQNATTEDFITFAEKTSGKPLHGLFQDWLYGTTKPPLPTK